MNWLQQTKKGFKGLRKETILTQFRVGKCTTVVSVKEYIVMANMKLKQLQKELIHSNRSP